MRLHNKVSIFHLLTLFICLKRKFTSHVYSLSVIAFGVSYITTAFHHAVPSIKIVDTNGSKTIKHPSQKRCFFPYDYYNTFKCKRKHLTHKKKKALHLLVKIICFHYMFYDLFCCFSLRMREYKCRDIEFSLYL